MSFRVFVYHHDVAVQVVKHACAYYAVADQDVINFICDTHKGFLRNGYG